MFIYKKTEPQLWTVGHYHPITGQFEPESDHSEKEAAAERVHYLNGGNIEITTSQEVRELYKGAGPARDD